MENESPTKSFTFNPTNNRSIERNVLKEINHIEEVSFQNFFIRINHW